MSRNRRGQQRGPGKSRTFWVLVGRRTGCRREPVSFRNNISPVLVCRCPEAISFMLQCRDLAGNSWRGLPRSHRELKLFMSLEALGKHIGLRYDRYWKLNPSSAINRPFRMSLMRAYLLAGLPFSTGTTEIEKAAAVDGLGS